MVSHQIISTDKQIMHDPGAEIELASTLEHSPTTPLRLLKGIVFLHLTIKISYVFCHQYKSGGEFGTV